VEVSLPATARPQKYAPRPLELVPGTSPAAGANFSLTSPGRPGWKLVAVLFRLVTDANAANRSVTVDYDDGNGSLFVSNGIQGVVTASTTALFCFTSGRTVSEANVNNQVFAPLQPAEFMGGQKLQVNVLNKQAGDQLDRVVLVFERQEYAAS
jgi:hypothetical protein